MPSSCRRDGRRRLPKRWQQGRPGQPPKQRLVFTRQYIAQPLTMTSMKVTAALFALAVGSQIGIAESADSPYVGQEDRAIKALDAKDVDGLLAGSGMGYAKAAELNGYPGPMHVLELAEKL